MRTVSGSRLRASLSLALLSAALGACAPALRLTPELRSSVRTVRIAATVPLRGAVLIDQPVPGIFPSPVISLDAHSDGQRRLDRAMAESGVDLGQIVREELARELFANGPFELVDEGEADARLEVELAAAGYGPANPFVYYRRRPRLHLWAHLIRESDGALLATGRTFVTALNHAATSYTIEELVDDPELVRAGFTTVARILSERVVRDLRAR